MDNATRAKLGLKRKPMSDNAKAILAVVTILVAYGIVGEMDYQDSISSSHETCMYRRA